MNRLHRDPRTGRIVVFDDRDGDPDGEPPPPGPVVPDVPDVPDEPGTDQT